MSYTPVACEGSGFECPPGPELPQDAVSYSIISYQTVRSGRRSFRLRFLSFSVRSPNLRSRPFVMMGTDEMVHSSTTKPHLERDAPLLPVDVREATEEVDAGG